MTGIANGTLQYDGNIVGTFHDISYAYHGFLLPPGCLPPSCNPTPFDDPNANGFTFAYDISPGTGEIVGYYVTSAYQYYGFLDVNGALTTIDDWRASHGCPSCGTSTFGINDAQEIVGSYTDLAGKPLGFIDKGGTFSDLWLGQHNAVTAVNGDGHVCGWYEDSSGLFHGFLWSSSLTTLDYPDAYATWANGVNDSDQVVGTYESSDGGYHGFLYDHGNWSTITFPSAWRSYAYEINDNGQTVGAYVLSDGSVHGFQTGPPQ